jgi:hypothetical protein
LARQDTAAAIVEIVLTDRLLKELQHRSPLAASTTVPRPSRHRPDRVIFWIGRCPFGI